MKKDARMNYHLYENWAVTVDLKISYEGAKYSFRFDFIVKNDIKFPRIIDTAKTIIEEKFGHQGYEITQISLSTSG